MAESDNTVTSSTTSCYTIPTTLVQHEFKYVEGPLSFEQCRSRLNEGFGLRHKGAIDSEIHALGRINRTDQIYTIAALVPSKHFFQCQDWCRLSQTQIKIRLNVNMEEHKIPIVKHHTTKVTKAYFL
jgi:hypothetical protein